MKKNIFIPIICILMSIAHFVEAAKTIDWHADFDNINTYISYGDYKNAKKYHKLLLTYTYKKKGADHPLYAALKFQEARIYNGTGEFVDYNTALEQGLKITNMHKEIAADNAIAAAEAALALVEYGNSKQAKEILLPFVNKENQEKLNNPAIVNDINWVQTKILLDQGYYKQAIQLLDKVKASRYLAIVTSREVKDPKTGNVKIKKLSTKEVAQLKRNYADALTLGLQIFLTSGDFISADSMFQTNQFWIKQQLGSTDVSMVPNLYFKGMIEEENEIVKSEYKFYNAAYTLLKTSKGYKYSPSSPLAGMINEKSILAAKKILKYKEATKIQINYEAAWKRAFPKNNYYRASLDILSASRQIIEEDYKNAEKEINELVASNTIIPTNHIGKIRVLKLQNQILLTKDGYDVIESNLKTILKIKENQIGNLAPAYHQSMLDLADFYLLYSSKLKEAENIYDNSLVNIISKEMDYKSKVYINNLYQHAKLYQITDRFKKSEQILTSILSNLKNRYSSTHPFYAEAQEKLAILDIELGNYTQAETKLQSSLAILKSQMEELDVVSQYTEALEAMAMLQILQGRYNEARATLRTANKIIKKEISKDQQKSSVANEELNYLNIYTGVYQGTQKSLLQSIAVRERRFGSQSRTLITPYNQLAELSLITGDYTNGEIYARKAAALSKSIFGEQSSKYAESLSLLEKVYSAIGDYQKALEEIKEVLQIQTKVYGENNFHTAQTLNRLALVQYYNKGKNAEIEQNFKKSLQIIAATLGDKNPEYANVLKDLGLFYIETNRGTEATPLLTQAKNIYLEKFGKDNIYVAQILMLQGNFNHDQRKYELAKDNYTEASSIYAKVFDTENPSYTRAISKVGQMNYILGDNKSAIKNLELTTANYLSFIKRYFPALSEREKTKYWNLIKDDFEFFNTMAMQLSKDNPQLVASMYNNILKTKSILLNSSIKVKERILASKDPAMIAKYEEYVGKKELLASAISMSTEDRKNGNVDLKSIEKEIEALEKSLSSSSELFAQNNEKDNDHSWEKIRATLKPSEIAIEMIRFRKYTNDFSDTIVYAALIITPETKGTPELVIINNGHQLETKNIKYYKNAIKLKLEDKISYDAFWKPFQTYCKPNSTVYFSPDGVYNQINLETLLSNDNKFLIDNYNIVHISTTRDLIPVKKNSKSKATEQDNNKTITLIGNPQYYDGKKVAENDEQPLVGHVDQLPGSEKEVKDIAILLKSEGWKTQLFLGKQAVEDTIKSLENPKVFHIATHGFFLEDPKVISSALAEEQLYRNPLLNSGLLLNNGGALMGNSNVYDLNSADGVLTAYEAMSLNFDKTDLVILSACETGLGEVQLGEGVYGLQRSFLVAGAQSVIMSLFKVDDKVTQELMMSFYKKWLKSGDRRQSFVEAKKEIKRNYPDPIYWGSFVMIGTN